MPNQPNREREIFNAALELTSAEARITYLRDECGEDAELRARVETLLRADERAGGFLPADDSQPQAEDSAKTISIAMGMVPVTEKPGDRIGRYKLREKVGEGGCGVVYVAEQEEPVRRRVALKVIKLGMDTRSVIARFGAERQALAMMDHPNIAKVLDAGATDTGRPYFVMELVRGIKITDYCDQYNLPTRERLDLFIKVCQAIQHAHQKGIVHRDLKPSNILVTLHDGVPVPKIIDFGIAKATEGRLTDLTVYTELHQFLGTPAYMSPEQAEMSGLDIDTRSDIYSLGVLLYELLTGGTPFNSKELLESGLDAMRKTIRETEPLRPSTRLSTMLNADLTAVARHHRAEPPKLVHLIRGDLDWIVMKSLEKDRARRYDTANGLAMDIQRHLSDEPIVARPPSNLYRFQKMVRRNRLAFAAAAGVVVALALGLCLAAWSLLRERAARTHAEASQKAARSEAAKSQQVARFLQDMLQSVGPSVAQGRDTAMLREILDKTAEGIGNDLTNQPEVEAELRTTIGLVYQELAQWFKAEDALRKALDLRRKLPGADLAVAVSLRNLGYLVSFDGRPSEARPMLEEALAINRRLLGNENMEVVKCLSELINALHGTGTLAETEAMARQALVIQKKVLGREHKDVAFSLAWLAGVQAAKGELAEAEATAREALAMDRKVLGDRHPETAGLLADLSGILLLRGKLAEAEAAAREADTMYVTLMGNEFPFQREFLEMLPDVLRAEGKQAEAAALVHERMVNREQALSERLANQPGRSDFLYERGLLRARMGRWREAAADLSRLVELRPEFHHNLSYLAAVLAELGDLEAYRRLCAQIRERFGRTEVPEIAMRMGWTCLMVPSSDPANLVIGGRLADVGVRNYKGDWYSLTYQSCKALAEYRQGHFASAAEWSSKALSQTEYSFCCDLNEGKAAQCGRVEASMVLAMSNYHLRQLDEARGALARGLAIADTKLPKVESGDLGYFWRDWVFAQVLMREAKALIEGGGKAGIETKANDPSALRKDAP